MQDRSTKHLLTAATYAKLIESIDGVIWEADPRTMRMTYVSPAAERLFGYPAERWLEPGFWINLVHPKDRTWVIDYCRRETLAGRSHDFEYRMVTANNQIRWIRDIVTVVEEAGETRLRGLMINITDTKEVEEERRERVRLLECLDRIARAIQRSDQVDQMLADALDVLLDTFPCQRAWLLQFPDSRSNTWQAIMERTKEGYSRAFAFSLEFPLDENISNLLTRSMDFEEPHVDDRISSPPLPEVLSNALLVHSQLSMAIRPQKGGSYLLGLHQCEPMDGWCPEDIQLFKQIGQRLSDALSAQFMKQMLSESELRFRTIFDHAIDAIFIHDTDGEVLDANKQATKNLGFSKEELVGKYPDFFDPDYDRNAEDHFTELLDRGELLHFCTRHRRIDGTIYPVEVWVKRFYIGHERLAISLSRDLSERSRLEEQFRQSQKMEAVGRLAGGMAHDFNNLLTVIGGYCELLMNDRSMTGKKREFATEIRSACDRATTLTQQLLAFSRQKLMQPQVVDINHCLENLQSLLSRLISEDIELQIFAETQSANTRIDPGQLEHAIVNLVVNARDAMPEGGRIEIRTRHCESVVASNRLGCNLTLSHGFIVISVMDTGIGMDDSVRSRIYEPFFTTKEQGKGTGLGLTMVYGFVQQSEGYIEVESKLGQGTTFHIYLPSVENSASVPSMDSPTTPNLQGQETILLAEDEQKVRELASFILERSGYKVLVALNGRDALRVAQEFPNKIDLLLSDLVMPQLNGVPLAEQLLLTRPETKILFMSGYLDHGAAPKLSSLREFGFCQKPFTAQNLLAKVRQTLHEKAAP